MMLWPMRKYFALSLVLIMAAVSLNAGIATHFCRGELAQMKLVLGHGQATCGMEATEIRDRTQTQVEAAPCCEDDFKQIKVDEVHADFQSTELSRTFTSVGLVGIVTLLEAPTPNRILASYRAPPDVNAVLLPFVQVFRI